MFLPTNKEELKQRGWDSCDIIIVTGDAYVDHPSFGSSMIARYLESLGYKVGIISQPNWKSNDDFLKLGNPKLFVGITAGNIDSMLAHYTANKKLRSDDAYTEGNIHGKRPNRATIVYTNKIKELMPGIPVVIGGLEASMRRLAHYDFWDDKVRKSILIDSKADILVYGMGESQIKEIANCIKNNLPVNNIPGTAIVKTSKKFSESNYSKSILLPEYSEVITCKDKFIEQTTIVEQNLNPYNAKTLIQKHENKYVIVFPPALPSQTQDLDSLYNLKFVRKPHYSHKDKIPAYEMIKNSITILRGCAGGCSYCSIGLHQGKIIQSRSTESILSEIKLIAEQEKSTLVISDLGGPTANMYMLHCKDIDRQKTCKRPSCLYPKICSSFNASSKPLISLLKKARNIDKIKKINISSGIRLDLAVINPDYIFELVKYHTPGHLKVAPEHFDDNVLKLMRKYSFSVYKDFSDIFYKINKRINKKQFLLPYLMTSFPGCTMSEIRKIADYLKLNKIKVEQIQDFIPLPMTSAATMYYTEKNITTKKKIYVAKSAKERNSQKQALLWWK